MAKTLRASEALQLRGTAAAPETDPERRPTPESDPIDAVALLEEPTRRRLYEHVAGSHREVGRDEAASALGISRELAAFHLDRLARGGLLEIGYRRLGSRVGPGAGRPAKLYRRSEREVAVTFPSRRYESLAEVFAEGLERLAEQAGTTTVAEAVESIARERGREVGAQARGRAGSRPGQRQLKDALVGLLGRAGYEPEVDPRSGAVTLCNCPYRAVSSAHRDLTCGANLAWAEGVVDGLGTSKLNPERAPAQNRCCVVFADEALRPQPATGQIPPLDGT